jgi:hypothetical protein
LDSRTYYQAIEKLNEVYDFNIVRDTYEEKSDSDTQTDEQTDTETTIGGESDDAENEESGDDDDAESTAIDDGSDERDEAADDVAYDVENGISVDDINGEMGDNEPAKEQTDSTTEADEASADQAETDGTTRFQTYEEPDLDNPAIDVDTDAVNQFINEFAVTDPEGEYGLGMKKDPMITAFTQWAKINNVELDELTEDKQLSKRKGTMKKILNTLINSESKKVSTDDGRVRGYTRIELSDEGEMLLDQNAE